MFSVCVCVCVCVCVFVVAVVDDHCLSGVVLGFVARVMVCRVGVHRVGCVCVCGVAGVATKPQ